jgi:hypothetical protein
VWLWITAHVACAGWDFFRKNRHAVRWVIGNKRDEDPGRNASDHPALRNSTAMPQQSLANAPSKLDLTIEKSSKMKAARLAMERKTNISRLFEAMVMREVALRERVGGN